MNPVTISVARSELLQAIDAVRPHLLSGQGGEDDDMTTTLPAIASVRFEARGQWLYVAATDRYSIGVARVRIPGSTDQQAEWLLPWDEVYVLTDQLAASDDAIAALTVTDREMTVDCGPCGGTCQLRDPGLVWPDWREMLGNAWHAPKTELGDSYGIDPALLTRFNIIQDGRPGSYSGRSPLHLSARTRRDTNMPIVLITFEDWFIGAVMPVRSGPYYPSDALDTAGREFWPAVLATTPEENPTP